jgi:transcription elongation factor Elf1
MTTNVPFRSSLIRSQCGAVPSDVRERPMKQDEDGLITELQYRCPHTNVLVDTGILTEPATLKKTWNNSLNVHCPHCGMYHHFRVRDAFIEQISTLRGAA